MFFLRLLLITFFLITQAKSDIIYTLIGIKNLEILNSNSHKNLIYLKANSSFQAGIRENNVTCFKTKEDTIKKKFKLIEKNFNKYTSNFLKKVNLKYIVLCEDLSVSGIDAAGIANSKKKTIIINMKINLDILERILHHETFHIINDSYVNLFPEKKWKKINNPKFKYAECSTCTDKLNLYTNDKTNGFITEYSKSTASEDMAEVFSYLMTNKNLINKKAINDIVLKNKILFIKKGILKIDSEFKL